MVQARIPDLFESVLLLELSQHIPPKPSIDGFVHAMVRVAQITKVQAVRNRLLGVRNGVSQAGVHIPHIDAHIPNIRDDGKADIFAPPLELALLLHEKNLLICQIDTRIDARAR